jgi:dolichol-phosphate mannosyltransferase
MQLPIKSMQLSIVIPTFNSASYIKETLSRVHKALIPLNISFEIIIVDDNSKDNTLKTCLEAQKQIQQIRILHLGDNYGQRIATTIGYNDSKADYVLTYDDDLQYLEDDILTLYQSISKSKKLILSAYYEYPNVNKFYKLNKQVVLFLFNQVFFAKYKNCKYLTSFKIYHKSKLKGFNPFYFWSMNPKDIGVLKVQKIERIKGVGNYNPKQFFRLLGFLVVKSLDKLITVFILISLIMSIYFQTKELFGWSLILLIIKTINNIYLYLDKKRASNIHYTAY